MQPRFSTHTDEFNQSQADLTAAFIQKYIASIQIIEEKLRKKVNKVNLISEKIEKFKNRIRYSEELKKKLRTKRIERDNLKNSLESLKSELKILYSERNRSNTASSTASSNQERVDPNVVLSSKCLFDARQTIQAFSNKPITNKKRSAQFFSHHDVVKHSELVEKNYETEMQKHREIQLQKLRNNLLLDKDLHHEFNNINAPLTTIPSFANVAANFNNPEINLNNTELDLNENIEILNDSFNNYVSHEAQSLANLDVELTAEQISVNSELVDLNDPFNNYVSHEAQNLANPDVELTAEQISVNPEWVDLNDPFNNYVSRVAQSLANPDVELTAQQISVNSELVDLNDPFNNYVSHEAEGLSDTNLDLNDTFIYSVQQNSIELAQQQDGSLNFNTGNFQMDESLLGESSPLRGESTSSAALNTPTMADLDHFFSFVSSPTLFSNNDLSQTNEVGEQEDNINLTFKNN